MTKLKDLRSQVIVLALVTALALGADGSGCFGTADPTLAAVPLAAPAEPGPVPVIGLSANGATTTELHAGWPLLLDVVLLHPHAFEPAADADPIVIGAEPTTWSQAVRLEVQSATGDVISWPIERAEAETADLRLDAAGQGDLLAWISPENTAALAAGDYVLTARLDTRAATAAGVFVGVAESVPVSVHVRTEPDSLTGIDEVRMLERFARYHALVGDEASARGAAEELALLHPESPRGFALLGDLDVGAGATAQALAHFEAAVDAFHAANPDAEEPPTELLARRRGLRSDLLRASQGVGVPRVSARVTARGTGPVPDVLYVDLLVTNAGDATAVDTLLEGVSPRVLAGTGAIELDRERSPVLPLHLPMLDPGGSTTLRFFFSLPATVQRFALEERGIAQGEFGGDYRFSVSQAVTR